MLGFHLKRLPKKYDPERFKDIPLIHRKSLVVLCTLLLFGAVSISAVRDVRNDPVHIPPDVQRAGDAEAGFEYLVTGDFLKSGFPYKYFTLAFGKTQLNELQRTGYNANVPYNFNVVTADNGTTIVIPTCLQCHAGYLNDSLIIGLGNTTLDFTRIDRGSSVSQKMMLGLFKTFAPGKYDATSVLLRSLKSVAPLMKTEVQGVNAADRLAILLVAHRDPQTLSWTDEPLLEIPEQVVPTDVPAWWLLKKKNAMFYNGFGRGDFGRFLMLSNLLTVSDTNEAHEVFSHFADVLAYIKTIQPPKYPLPVNGQLAAAGKNIFEENCSRCHGTYGMNGEYPNLLIPGSVIQTDSMLYASNQQNPQFVDWFNKSWYANGAFPAKLVPYNGYMAPPLDGIWATAPYLHNGSVPSLEAVLNSKLRPTYWKRNFKNPHYLPEQFAWEYSIGQPGEKGIYNTTLSGYSNAGHYFGDHLSDSERKAVIEYLKTL